MTGSILAAALLVLALAGGYAVLLRETPGPGAPAGNNAAVPGAQQASPTASAADESLPGDVTLEFAFPSVVVPAGEVAAWMQFFEVLPHEGGEYTITGTSAVILVVRAGTMAISGELAGVHRATDAAPAASPVAGETILGPGDAAALAFTSDQVFPIRNVGDDKLYVVEAAVSNLNLTANKDMLGLDMAEYTMQPGATTLPADSTVTVRLTRATLAPDESRAPAAEGWQLAIGDPARMTRSPMDGTVRNVSDEPHEVYILTAEFAPAAATPVP